MNKIIQKQLLQVKEVNLQFDNNTTSIFIPRKVGFKLEEGKYYLIKLSKFMTNPPSNSIINSNWNQGRVPQSECYKAEITKIMNNMVNITGVGYDYNNKTDLSTFWSGWVPKQEMEILEVL